MSYSYSAMSKQYGSKTLKQTTFSVRHDAGALNAVISKKHPVDHAEFAVDWEHKEALGGHANADADNPYLEEKFLFYVVNRPIVLKNSNGLMGWDSIENPRMILMQDRFEPVTMIPAPHGGCYLRASNHKFFSDRDGEVRAEGIEPIEFKISMRGNSKISFQTPDGKYLTSRGNLVTLEYVEPDDSVLWEITRENLFRA